MNCLFCDEVIKDINKFCDRSCAASYNNLRRVKEGYSLKGKNKIVECLNCGALFEVGVNSALNVRCEQCAYQKISNGAKNCEIICKDCGLIVIGCCDRKYCDPCASIRIGQGARHSVAIQKELRRSKNEIYFAELCQNYFGINDVKTNEPMFDGWDADIIIESLKIAILWNGKWHYQKITIKHSVAQVQNRDRIKMLKIQAYNYIPYTIKDMGSHNKEFVEREFSSMVEHLSHKQNTTDHNR